ncbi:MAG: zinc ribbon domain-containing protein [Candidatus Omnitrophica bacterium]|nr:zinc ribbon domain-containing protein [Candidatus Omnitrophota bacterium]
MTQIPCKECQKEISSKAVICPHCGVRVRPWWRNRALMVVLMIVGCFQVFTAIAFIFDSILYWLPQAYSDDVYAIDWKEMWIGFGYLIVGFGLVLLAARGAFTKGHAMRRYGHFLLSLGVACLTLVLCLASHFKISTAQWFTNNVVGKVTVDGEKRSYLLRYRVLQFPPKPAQVLKARVVKMEWSGIPKGTKLTMGDNTEVSTKEDLVEIKFSLEVRNTSSDAARLMSVPSVGNEKKAVFESLHFPIQDGTIKDFPDNGIPFSGHEVKVIELDSSLQGYDEVKDAGDLFVTHGSYDDWHENLSPLPARDVLYKSQ